MGVFVVMRQGFVSVRMIVPFGQVQGNTNSHQRAPG